MRRVQGVPSKGMSLNVKGCWETPPNVNERVLYALRSGWLANPYYYSRIIFPGILIFILGGGGETLNPQIEPSRAVPAPPSPPATTKPFRKILKETVAFINLRDTSRGLNLLSETPEAR